MSRPRFWRIAVLALGFALLAWGSSAQAQDRPRRWGRGRRGAGRGGDGPAREAREKKGVQPYDEVITDEVKTDTGLFSVHRKGDELYFEIPPAELGKDMLWVTQIEKTQAGFGYGGTGSGNRVVRWELRDEKVLLRDVKYTIRADVDDPVKNAVEATSLAPIIRVFDVRAWGKDRAPVIEVTDLYTSDVREFSAARRLGASGVDGKRSWIEEVKSFPTNLETKVLLTYRLSGSSENSGRNTPRRRPRRGPRRDPRQSAVTALIHHSMVRLPARPMAPRLFDSRVGFFTVSFEDYGSDEHEVERVKYITRWRLEKRNPGAEISDPVQPIVFYVGRGVPEKWRPWVRKGIEAWQPAFEAAGFSNAIIARAAPSRREDPDWDAEDARYSTIRWLPSTIENAMGPHVSDPRTGEILEADIIVYHNILKLVRDWYFSQASPSDERARTLPLPDDLLGELLAYVITHEVGHSLGFPHNMKASSAYTVAQLRDPEFTARYGTEASIMDYGRFNYVAQPGDGASLIPVVGPYDYFAVEWGYRQFDGVSSPEDEKPLLADVVARQVDDPMLRFGDPNPAEDPTQQTEDLGSDPIAATEMGLKNIDRVLGYLIDATCEQGEDYSLLRNMYDVVLSQRGRELGHVANVIGGVERANLWFGDAERIYTSVSAERQRAAVAFLDEHCFRTPSSLLDPGILARLEADGATTRVLREQRRVLSSVLSERRLRRMGELAERAEGVPYLPAELLRDVRRAIWRELLADSGARDIDLYRRNLQRAHLDQLIEELDKESADSDFPALARGELEAIGVLAQRQAGFPDTVVAHLRHVAARVDAALDPSRRRPDAEPTPATVRRSF